MKQFFAALLVVGCLSSAHAVVSGHASGTITGPFGGTASFSASWTRPSAYPAGACYGYGYGYGGFAVYGAGFYGYGGGYYNAYSGYGQFGHVGPYGAGSTVITPSGWYHNGTFVTASGGGGTGSATYHNPYTGGYGSATWY